MPMRLLSFALALLGTARAEVAVDVELGLGTDLGEASDAEYFSVGLAIDRRWLLSDPDEALAAGGRLRFTTGTDLLPPLISLEGGIRRTWNAGGDWPWGFSAGGGPVVGLGDEDDPRFGGTARLGLGFPAAVEISTVGTWLIRPDDADWRLGLELTLEPDPATLGQATGEILLRVVAGAAAVGLVLLLYRYSPPHEP